MTFRQTAAHCLRGVRLRRRERSRAEPHALAAVRQAVDVIPVGHERLELLPALAIRTLLEPDADDLARGGRPPPRREPEPDALERQRGERHADQKPEGSFTRRSMNRNRYHSCYDS